MLNFESRTTSGLPVMSITEIITALLAHDNVVTRTFFWGDEQWSVRRNLLKILYGVYHRSVDYDEAVGELYAYLMADGGRNLRSYDPQRSSFFYWFKTVAVRFFLSRRDGMIDSSPDAAIDKTDAGSEHIVEVRFRTAAPGGTDGGQAAAEAKADVRRLLLRMPNKRYAYVLHRLIVVGDSAKDVAAAMGIEVSNLYNIRRRAMEQLERTALNDNIHYHGKL